MAAALIGSCGDRRFHSLASCCSTRPQVWFSIGGYRAAKAAFVAIATGVVKSPMSFFETTPTGRILNRLTYDVGALLSIANSRSISSSSNCAAHD